MTYHLTNDIDAPPERVWSVVVDVERWPEWSETMTTIVRLDGGPFTTGSRARVKQPKLPEATWHVTSLQAPETFTWSCRTPGVTTTATHVLSPLEDGRTRNESSLQQTGPLAFVARLLYGRLIQRYLELEAQGLKKRSEAG